MKSHHAMKWNALLLSAAVAMTAVPWQVNAEPVSAQQQTAPAAFTILPIDRAQILAGQKLDFRVELNGAKLKSNDIKIQVNGLSPDKYFGKSGTWTSSNDLSTEYTIRDVTFKESDSIVVTAETIATGKRTYSRVVYQVFDPSKDTALLTNGEQAKNVVLMIGDGMSANIRTAARVVSKGIHEGKFNGWLEMEQMDSMGMVTTSGMDSIVTDSANSASAYATGHKTAVNAEGVYPDNTPDPFDDPKVENIVELVKRTRGMATGLVTTADVTDATPAAMAVHTRKRGEQEAIASMYLNEANRPDVILGGGLEWFLPAKDGGKRKDGRNIVEEFKKEGYTYVTDATNLDKSSSTKSLLGLFRKGNMSVYYDREYTQPNNTEIVGKDTDQPTLMEMTDTALQVLEQNKNGFFLMVEGASIDKQAHTMDFERSVWDAIEFDQSVGRVKEYAKEHPGTLVIVTSDHGHSLTLNGTYNTEAAKGKSGDELRELIGTYADSKFPTYVDANGDGFPDNPDSEWKIAVGWGNMPDNNEDYLSNPVPISPTIQDPNVKDKTWYIANPDKDPDGVHYTGNLPHDEGQEVHTFDDVPINASGPGSRLFSGYLDNTDVFRKMVTALKLDASK
ncbi:alkaline phosphatase [Paenibacillus sp. JNUCC31]|uniref:alkaline phosphatase n=1 Tax=Paenibacillus sp. JNUCC-31 TaxID=2777983 RepID=UPI00177C6E6D|nr:alkaline phosphatase [Paenibacillus sp. JNUCC-31]QOS79252.1 alkaline phosphatase [Paenibacillus sp. JNUCC-31]